MLKAELNNEKDQDLGQFLDEVFRLDQSDPQRTNAQKCHEMLKAREQDFLGSPLESFYWYSVSFELFHIVQHHAFTDQTDSAKTLLTESIAAASKSPEKTWLAYIEGVLCYLENNLEGLKQKVPLAGGNHVTLRKLVLGLEERGFPDYLRDYGRTI